MNKQEMIAKLERKDLHGVGVKVLYSDGCEIFYFYEGRSDLHSLLFQQIFIKDKGSL